MIMVNRADWKDKVNVLRGWGRSSALFAESENIEKRFKTKLGTIPYDAKFLFDEIGYNFLPNEMGSAFGNAQLEKLPKFRKIREYNFRYLINFFKNMRNFSSFLSRIKSFYSMARFSLNHKSERSFLKT